MKIVFLDAKTIGDDIDLSGYEELGEVDLAILDEGSQILQRHSVQM